MRHHSIEFALRQSFSTRLPRALSAMLRARWTGADRPASTRSCTPEEAERLAIEAETRVPISVLILDHHPANLIGRLL